MVSVLADQMEAIRKAYQHLNVVRIDILSSTLSEDCELDRSNVEFLMDFDPMFPLAKPDA